VMPGLAGLPGAGGVEDEVSALTSRLVEVEDAVAELPAALARLRDDGEHGRTALATQQAEALDTLRASAETALRTARLAVWVAAAAAVVAVAAVAAFL